MLRAFLSCLDKENKKKFNKIVILNFCSQFFEVILLSLLPFLISKLTYYQSSKLQNIEEFFFNLFFQGNLNENQKLDFLFYLLFFTILIKFVLSIITSKNISNLFKDLKIYFTNKVLEKKISIEYQKLKTLNKSSLVRETIIDTDIVIINIFLPLISIFSEIIIIIPALILLFLLNFYVLVAMILFLIIAYIIYNFFF